MNEEMEMVLLKEIQEMNHNIKELTEEIRKFRRVYCDYQNANAFNMIRVNAHAGQIQR